MAESRNSETSNGTDSNLEEKFTTQKGSGDSLKLLVIIVITN